MPIGFVLAGLWPPENDPGLVGIWLVPPDALQMIFGTTTLALSYRNSTSD